MCFQAFLIYITLDDPDLRPYIEDALSMFEKRVNRTSEILSMEGQPVPKGFGDEDIDSNRFKGSQAIHGFILLLLYS